MIEWDYCNNIWELWRSVKSVRKRKSFLIVCACIEQMPDIINNDYNKDCISAVKKYLDDPRNYYRSVRKLNDLYDPSMPLVCDIGHILTNLHIDDCKEMLSYFKEMPTFANIFKDIICNPRRSPIIEKIPQCFCYAGFYFSGYYNKICQKCNMYWYTPWIHNDDVQKFAEAIYEKNDFTSLPILADMLEDKGCENKIILSHLRGTAVSHWRGCWALDKILGFRDDL